MSYDDAAAAVEREGAIRPEDTTEREIQAKVREFLFIGDEGSDGARTLIDEKTDRVMDTNVGFTTAEGRDSTGNLGKRENVSTYTDRWGNVMGINENTGTRRKLIDSEDR